MTAHKHANLMMQYAQDAAESVTPWEMWEYKLHGNLGLDAKIILHGLKTLDTAASPK